jgi:hypothetical protein
MTDLPSPLEMGELPVVAHVENEYRVVINRGSESGVKMGQRFLIYGIGKEILDPVTTKSLGKLEFVRGTGKVIHLQTNMAVIESDMKLAGGRTIKKPDRGSPGLPYSGYSGYFERGYIEETQEPPVPLGFEDPKIGDFAKPI